MKEKKNIDRLFQEKFRDFEKEPSERVWEGIASKLEEKESKKPVVIPLWLKLSGVAAVLALIFSSLLFTGDPVISSEPQIVFEEKEKSSDQSDQSGNSQESGKHTTETSNTANQIVLEEKNTTNGLTGTNSNEQLFSNSDVANSISSDSGNSRPVKKPNIYQSGVNSEKTALVHNDKISNRARLQKSHGIQAGEIKNTTDGITALSENFQNDPSFKNKDPENALALLENEKNQNEEEKYLKAEAEARKMRLSTFASPVFYKNIGSGNELSNQFSENASSTEVSLAYGVKLAYKLSDKLRLRTGVSKLNMSYNIQDISYSPMSMAGGIENIRPTEENPVINNEPGRQGSLPMSGGDNNSLAVLVVIPGEINQQFGFIEVPLELEYSLIDKKFGLNIIGGGSSLFLDDNRVDVISENTKTSLGEATNINKTSFSTNIGVGMDYKLTEKFSLSLEPIFKYQINTFNDVENVQPVNFGIYSGLSFKF